MGIWYSFPLVFMLAHPMAFSWLYKRNESGVTHSPLPGSNSWPFGQAHTEPKGVFRQRYEQPPLSRKENGN